MNMEEIFTALKDLIVSKLPDYLTAMSTQDTPLPALTAKDVVFGSVDLLKYRQNVLCAILPESTEDTEGTISDSGQQSQFTVAFVCRGQQYEVLVRQMCRYASAFHKMIVENYSLNKKVQNTEMGNTQFFYDPGTVEKQLTACEIDLTVLTENDDDFEL